MIKVNVLSEDKSWSKKLKKKVLILGAGGVVPSIIFALQRMGVKHIMLSNRTKLKAQ